MEENTQPALPPINPAIKALSHIIILMGLYFTFGVLFSLLGTYLGEWIIGVPVKLDTNLMLADLADENKKPAYKIYFLVSSLGAFVFTALVFSIVFARQKPREYFGYKRVFPPAKQFALVAIIAVVAVPIISYIAYLTRQITMPAEWADAMNLQRTNDSIGNAIIRADNIPVLLFNLCVMAIAPALGEELLFRGAFMQTFYRLFGNRIHIAVFTVAFLFSAVHLQVYNFLAIMMMGVLFGYLYYWSGNIMVSVWAHFFNNALAVLSGYLYTLNPSQEVYATEYEFGWQIALICSVVFVLAVIAFYKVTRPYHAEGE